MSKPNTIGLGEYTDQDLQAELDARKHLKKYTEIDIALDAIREKIAYEFTDTDKGYDDLNIADKKDVEEIIKMVEDYAKLFKDYDPWKGEFGK